MIDGTIRIVMSNKGSASRLLILAVLTLVILVASLRLMRDDEQPDVAPTQTAQHAESKAFYIAQTALDRSIKALVANPRWRDGFRQVTFEDGVYDVEVYDWSNAKDGAWDPDIPPNYIRIIASSEIDGVSKQVEAIWVNAMSAFQYAYAAGNNIDIDNHVAASTVVVGDMHNNAWEGGAVAIKGGARVYADVTTVGEVSVGDAHDPAVIYGSVWGSEIEVAGGSDVLPFDELDEATQGIDLNRDGDTNDIGLNKPVRSFGNISPGPVVDPRPDFRAYYELVTGVADYPPLGMHAETPIAGDGDGHYFASAAEFANWLLVQDESPVNCWRCAGDGRIDPSSSSSCPDCYGTGRDNAVVVSGVFYIDDEILDLGGLGRHLVIHGTVVVAQGNPYRWPSKTVDVPGGTAAIDHFPERGQFILGGETRPHFTQTYRSDEEGGLYVWNTRAVHAGDDEQHIAVPEPDARRAMRGWPAILAAEQIVIEPRHTGFARHQGDIGDEKLTVLQGILYAGEEVRLHGTGGWNDGPVVFDETLGRRGDDALDEPVLNVDLNGDGEMFDHVELSEITTVPVIPVSNSHYTVDINNDGVLGQVPIGDDYLGFFNDAGYTPPILIYCEGIVLGQSIHSCEQVLVTYDDRITQAGMPFGFAVSFGTTTNQGLVKWWERHR